MIRQCSVVGSRATTLAVIFSNITKVGTLCIWEHGVLRRHILTRSSYSVACQQLRPSNWTSTRDFSMSGGNQSKAIFSLKQGEKITTTEALTTCLATRSHYSRLQGIRRGAKLRHRRRRSIMLSGIQSWPRVRLGYICQEGDQAVEFLFQPSSLGIRLLSRF